MSTENLRKLTLDLPFIAIKNEFRQSYYNRLLTQCNFL